MSHDHERTESEGDQNVSERVQDLIYTGLSRDVLVCLHQESPMEKTALFSTVTNATVDGNISHDDRIRLAVELEVDVLPELESHDLISRDDNEVSLGFLSAPEYAALESVAASKE